MIFEKIFQLGFLALVMPNVRTYEEPLSPSLSECYRILLEYSRLVNVRAFQNRISEGQCYG